MGQTKLLNLAVERQAAASLGALPYISVVLPVRNEAAFIGCTLDQLLAQDYPPEGFEVLVADGCSTDETAARVRECAAHHSHVRLLHNPARLSSAGRNQAIRVAKGDVILLIDGHCEIPSRSYLSDLARVFAKSGADCVGRPQPLDVPGASAVQRAIAAARTSRLGHHPASYIYSSAEGFVPPQSVAIAYRREVFEQVGHFDEQFDACEDVEFNHRVARAGLRCWLTPRALVRYHPRSSLGGLYQQMARYGRGRVRLLKKHPATFSAAVFLPALLLVGAALGWLSALFSQALFTAYAQILCAYLLILLATSGLILRRTRDWATLPWLPLVFAAIHGGAGAGVLDEVIRGWRRRGPVKPRELPGRIPADLLSPVCDHSTRHLGNPPFVPAPLNAMTIDVEDYFQVSGFDNCVDRADWDALESRVVPNTHKILDLLSRQDVRATFFILGWVADRYPQLVRDIDRAGHEIGCHSYAHNLIYRQSPNEFRADLRRARDILQELVTQPVTAYRAPSFSITQASAWALDILIEEGFKVDSSIYPALHDRYGMPGTPLQPYEIRRPAGILWECPLPVYRRFRVPIPIGGGGYLRLYPYACTRWGLRAINAAGRSFVVYLHPWEMDPEQPRVAAGLVRTFRHRVNLGRTEDRLKALLSDFSFGRLADVLERHQAAGSAPHELASAA